MRVFIANPALLFTLRIFRIFRSMRILKATKGIRKLLYAFLISLPALLNIAALLLLVIFIYAIIGMNLFMNVKLQNSLTSKNNFQKFGKSFIILFRLSTFSSWQKVLFALMLTNDDPGSNCSDSYDIQSLPSSVDPRIVNGKIIYNLGIDKCNCFFKGCGKPQLAILYLVSYIIIVRMMLINMYIAIIIENYNEAQEQEEIGVTEDDFEEFFLLWEKYDPYATQFIKLGKIYDFVSEMPLPLGVRKPNFKAVNSLNLPIIKGDLIHCLDIVHALTVNVLGKLESSEEFTKIKKQMDEKFLLHFPVRVKYKPITTTMERTKLEIAARKIQITWKKFKIKKMIRKNTIWIRRVKNNLKNLSEVV